MFCASPHHLYKLLVQSLLILEVLKPIFFLTQNLWFPMVFLVPAAIFRSKSCQAPVASAATCWASLWIRSAQRWPVAPCERPYRGWRCGRCGWNSTWFWDVCWQCGYESIPINTIFNGMNIHLPAILMWTTGVQGSDTLPCDRVYSVIVCFKPLKKYRDI